MEFIIFALLAIFNFYLGVYIGEDEIRKQAFERGHMIECVGKSGYYWECEE